MNNHTIPQYVPCIGKFKITRCSDAPYGPDIVDEYKSMHSAHEACLLRPLTNIGMYVRMVSSGPERLPTINISLGVSDIPDPAVRPYVQSLTVDQIYHQGRHYVHTMHCMIGGYGGNVDRTSGMNISLGVSNIPDPAMRPYVQSLDLSQIYQQIRYQVYTVQDIIGGCGGNVDSTSGMHMSLSISNIPYPAIRPYI